MAAQNEKYANGSIGNVAAQNEKYANGSIGNVTGSNAVNLFLGTGLSWTCAAIYQPCNGSEFIAIAGNLGFSVTVFCSFAFLAIILMMFRSSSKNVIKIAIFYRF